MKSSKSSAGVFMREAEEQWGEQDSNLRRHSQRVYSPSPLTTRTSPRATAILESFGRSVRPVDRNGGRLSPFGVRSPRPVLLRQGDRALKLAREAVPTA